MNPFLFALVLALTTSMSANAFTFTEDLFALEIPESEKVYYYTHRGTNMTGTMLENAEKQDMLCLIGEYSTEGTLLYTFRAERREGTSDEVAAALRTELAASCALSEPQPENVAGRYGLSMNGENLQNENYAVTLYVSGDHPAVVFTTTYLPEAEADVLALVRSVTWPMERDPDAVALPGAQEEEPVDDPVPTPVAPAPIEPVGELPQSASALASVRTFAENNWQVVILAIAAMLALLLLALLLRPLARAARYQPRHVRR